MRKLFYFKKLKPGSQTKIIKNELLVTVPFTKYSLRWARHVARMEEGAFKILTAKPTGKRLLERSWRRWEDNIRMDLEEIGINTGN